MEQKNNNVLLLFAPIKKKKSYDTEAWGQSRLTVVCFDKEIFSGSTVQRQMAVSESMQHRSWGWEAPVLALGLWSLDPVRGSE